MHINEGVNTYHLEPILCYNYVRSGQSILNKIYLNYQI